ncbi:hypothetical protein H696_00661 [Fonticula alba]|uniref:methylated diphthine methylhydrolase n=1 Tax=Fonticula alba TaxID=691883 RepID=A0A058ZHX5_FONAL|nr:hypothetical protein H696_00661 [Fonticula alba]KCV73117.1 hypothetical protein H696_00661 [Fonticula alba]|eukprot:XP_009492818.1 hypothetical protein H696_00661 [Fonticula alba]
MSSATITFSRSSCAVTAHPNRIGLVTCATYQLDDSEKVIRSGDLHQIRLSGTRTPDNRLALECNTVSTFETCATLDAQWHAHSDTIATAGGDGRLSLYRYSPVTHNLSLLAASDILPEQQPMCLSLDWADRMNGRASPQLVTSDSAGGIHLFTLRPDGTLANILSGSGVHEFEAWIAAFGQPETPVVSADEKHVVFPDDEEVTLAAATAGPSLAPDAHPALGCMVLSGGDDGVFRGWDLRMGFDSSVFTNRSHNAGVTAVSAPPESVSAGRPLVVSGSYDQSVRVWDLRSPRRPLETFEVGGGVWRLRWRDGWDPSWGAGGEGDSAPVAGLLVAAMHGGFRVLGLGPGGALLSDGVAGGGNDLSTPEAVAAGSGRFPAAFHNSLAYGADWCRVPVTSSAEGTKAIETVGATCSFYDKTFGAWTPSDCEWS